MILTSNTFTHQLIEQTVRINDIVLDGTTANGINTRFLATRVGNAGKVLSYATTKDNANAAAASLFMSGLSDRVTLLGKTLDNQFINELGSQNQISFAIFDYSDDAKNVNDRPTDYLQQISYVLPRGYSLLNLSKYLKHGLNIKTIYLRPTTHKPVTLQGSSKRMLLKGFNDEKIFTAYCYGNHINH